MRLTMTDRGHRRAPRGAPGEADAAAQATPELPPPPAPEENPSAAAADLFGEWQRSVEEIADELGALFRCGVNNAAETAAALIEAGDAAEAVQLQLALARANYAAALAGSARFVEIGGNLAARLGAAWCSAAAA
jgi:hypothetical protein